MKVAVTRSTWDGQKAGSNYVSHEVLHVQPPPTGAWGRITIPVPLGQNFRNGASERDGYFESRAHLGIVAKVRPAFALPPSAIRPFLFLSFPRLSGRAVDTGFSSQGMTEYVSGVAGLEGCISVNTTHAGSYRLTHPLSQELLLSSVPLPLILWSSIVWLVTRCLGSTFRRSRAWV